MDSLIINVPFRLAFGLQNLPHLMRKRASRAPERATVQRVTTFTATPRRMTRARLFSGAGFFEERSLSLISHRCVICVVAQNNNKSRAVFLNKYRRKGTAAHFKLRKFPVSSQLVKRLLKPTQRLDTARFCAPQRV